MALTIFYFFIFYEGSIQPIRSLYLLQVGLNIYCSMEHPNSLNIAKPEAKHQMQEISCMHPECTLYTMFFTTCLEDYSFGQHIDSTSATVACIHIHVYTQAHKLTERENDYPTPHACTEGLTLYQLHYVIAHDLI